MATELLYLVLKSHTHVQDGLIDLVEAVGLVLGLLSGREVWVDRVGRCQRLECLVV